MLTESMFGKDARFVFNTILVAKGLLQAIVYSKADK